MASNSQIQESLVTRRKRSRRNPWIFLVIALALVTVPVLPLKFIGIPGPDFTQVPHLGSMLEKFQGKNEQKPKARSQKHALSPASIKSKDVELLDKTAQTLLRRISDKPEEPSLHNRLGLTLMELGENHTAITHFNQAIKLSKAKVSKLRAKANKAKQQNDINTAAEYITDISQVEIQLTAAHSSLARVYERLGKSDKVIYHLNELDKEVVLAGTYRGKKGSSTIAKAKDSKKDDSRLNATTASILAKANALKEAGRLQESIKEYKRLIEMAPKLEVAHLELGLTALRAHDYWLAENELKHTIKLNPNNATAHNALGDIYQSSQRTEKAIEQYTKTMALNPKISQAAFSLGNIYASKGQYAEAKEAFRSATKGNPKSAFAHNNFATMCSLSGDYQTAIVEFREAIRLSPDMASSHYGLGIALMNLKQYNQAIPAFKRALVLNPSLVDAHNKIAIAQRKRHAI